MKKIFSLFAAMLLTISVWGAVDRVYTMHSITDVVVTENKGISGYTVQFSCKGNSSYDALDYDELVTLKLAYTSSWLGTFIVGAETNELLSTSEVLWGTTSRCPVTSAGYESSITITKVEGQTYKISGFINAAKSKTSTTPYQYNFGDGVEFIYDPFLTEPAKGDDITFTGNSLYQKKFSDNNLYLDITDVQYNELYLQIVATKDTLEAGTYTVGTEIVASTEIVDYVSDYSGFYIGLYKAYGIVGGSLEISYSGDLKNLLMAGTLVTGHGTNIIVNNTLDNPWYVAPSPATGLNEAVAPNKAVKELINGQLYIRKEGKLYNVLGF